MVAAGIPANESERLQALRDLEILDTLAEEAFDRFTRIAAGLLGAPIALVSLVDEARQWFKSHHGLDATETPRDMAFCAYAVLNDDLLVVDDATKDPRFADNPLVTGAPDIRFYAGAPLRTRDNFAIGTLCVIDKQPRHLEPGQAELLADLADAVVNQLYLHKTTADLNKAQQAQARLHKAKTEFVSTVSHELRTPLTSIKGSLGLVQSGVFGELPEAFKPMIDIAYNNSDRLVRLINDLLDIEKMEAGKMDFHLAPVDLAALLRQSVAENAGYALTHNVSFKLVEPLASVKVTGDKDRLLQVMANLLSNAAKFSPPQGVIEVGLTRQDGMIRISITDHGPGIPENFQSKIFQKFSQADSSDAGHKGGTGLGLSICRAIVERHGGTIGFTTREGVGTSFHFGLPEDPA
jgi:signal transduction histidine kinase